jgi:cell division protein FtsL
MYHSRGRRSRGQVGTAEKVWIVLLLAVVVVLLALVILQGATGAHVGW